MTFQLNQPFQLTHSVTGDVRTVLNLSVGDHRVTAVIHLIWQAPWSMVRLLWQLTPPRPKFYLLRISRRVLEALAFSAWFLVQLLQSTLYMYHLRMSWQRHTSSLYVDLHQSCSSRTSTSTFSVWWKIRDFSKMRLFDRYAYVSQFDYSPQAEKSKKFE